MVRVTALAVVLAVPCALADPDPAATACHAFTPDADYVETTVVRQLEGGAVTLRVPRQYFEDPWDLAGGYTDTAQLFRVEIGSFEPVTRRETGERNARGVWDWIEFVASDVVSLQVVAVIGADLFAPTNTPLSAYPPRPGPHELAWLDTPHASDRPEPLDDVFVDAASSGSLETVIVCDSPLASGIASPVCKQHFRAAGLDTWVSYDRDRLSGWREFQAQVAAFLTCATSEAT